MMKVLIQYMKNRNQLGKRDRRQRSLDKEIVVEEIWDENEEDDD